MVGHSPALVNLSAQSIGMASKVVLKMGLIPSGFWSHLNLCDLELILQRIVDFNDGLKGQCIVHLMVREQGSIPIRPESKIIII